MLKVVSFFPRNVLCLLNLTQDSIVIICSVQFSFIDLFTDFYHVSHVRSNQQLTCVQIDWHEPIIVTKLNEGQYFSLCTVRNTHLRY